jgi:hypothetical protein
VHAHTQAPRAYELGLDVVSARIHNLLTAATITEQACDNQCATVGVQAQADRLESQLANIQGRWRRTQRSGDNACALGIAQPRARSSAERRTRQRAVQHSNCEPALHEGSTMRRHPPSRAQSQSHRTCAPGALMAAAHQRSISQAGSVTLSSLDVECGTPVPPALAQSSEAPGDFVGAEQQARARPEPGISDHRRSRSASGPASPSVVARYERLRSSLRHRQHATTHSGTFPRLEHMLSLRRGSRRSAAAAATVEPACALSDPGVVNSLGPFPAHAAGTDCIQRSGGLSRSHSAESALPSLSGSHEQWLAGSLVPSSWHDEAARGGIGDYRREFEAACAQNERLRGTLAAMRVEVEQLQAAPGTAEPDVAPGPHAAPPRTLHTAREAERAIDASNEASSGHDAEELASQPHEDVAALQVAVAQLRAERSALLAAAADAHERARAAEAASQAHSSARQCGPAASTLQPAAELASEAGEQDPALVSGAPAATAAGESAGCETGANKADFTAAEGKAAAEAEAARAACEALDEVEERCAVLEAENARLMELSAEARARLDGLTAAMPPAYVHAALRGALLPPPQLQLPGYGWGGESEQWCGSAGGGNGQVLYEWPDTRRGEGCQAGPRNLRPPLHGPCNAATSDPQNDDPNVCDDHGFNAQADAPHQKRSSRHFPADEAAISTPAGARHAADGASPAAGGDKAATAAGAQAARVRSLPQRNSARATDSQRTRLAALSRRRGAGVQGGHDAAAAASADAPHSAVRVRNWNVQDDSAAAHVAAER